MKINGLRFLSKKPSNFHCCFLTWVVILFFFLLLHMFDGWWFFTKCCILLKKLPGAHKTHWMRMNHCVKTFWLAKFHRKPPEDLIHLHFFRQKVGLRAKTSDWKNRFVQNCHLIDGGLKTETLKLIDLTKTHFFLEIWMEIDLMMMRDWESHHSYNGNNSYLPLRLMMIFRP